MGLVLLVLVLALVVGYGLGGRPLGLGRIHLRSTWLLLGAVALQLLDAALAPQSQATYVAALVVTALLAGAFVARNIAVPGVPLMGAGLLANGLVIAVNGAMPVSEHAARLAGAHWTVGDVDARHVALGDGTTLSWLGDVIPVANPLHREVVSIGDVLVAAGLGLLVVVGMLRGRRRPLGGSHDVLDEQDDELYEEADDASPAGPDGRDESPARLPGRRDQARRGERSTTRDSESMTRGS